MDCYVFIHRTFTDTPIAQFSCVEHRDIFIIFRYDSRFKIRLFIDHPRTSTISYAGNENDKHRSTKYYAARLFHL